MWKGQWGYDREEAEGVARNHMSEHSLTVQVKMNQKSSETECEESLKMARTAIKVSQTEFRDEARNSSIVCSENVMSLNIFSSFAVN